jgi:hypothetical protein
VTARLKLNGLLQWVPTNSAEVPINPELEEALPRAITPVAGLLFSATPDLAMLVLASWQLRQALA